LKSTMYSTDSEILEIVDSHDKVIGTGSRGEIHRMGFFHRAVHMFVFNPAGQVYIQRRSRSKDRHPGKLDSSAAGHVDPGETYEETAIRELQEELGIQAEVKEILRVPASEQTDNEHVVLFEVVTESEPVPNPEEIQWGAFLGRERVTRLMEEAPEDFVPAFILLWRKFIQQGR
jgi:isopentenyl-diphosphate delta-isomerase type 1